VPLRWEGLSVADADVLRRFLVAIGIEPDELHTHVPVGGTVSPPAGDHFARMGKMAAALYPRRVDAALRYGAAWWLVECKPDSRLHGLGQCLGYYYWWLRDCPECDISRVILACGASQPDEVAAFAAAGVEVVVV